MSMSLATLEILEQAQLPPAHARAIARAIEADSGARREDLATKLDLAELKGVLLRWTFLAVMGQTAASAGLMYFLLDLALNR